MNYETKPILMMDSSLRIVDKPMNYILKNNYSTDFP